VLNPPEVPEVDERDVENGKPKEKPEELLG